MSKFPEVQQTKSNYR